MWYNICKDEKLESVKKVKMSILLSVEKNANLLRLKFKVIELLNILK